MKRPSPEWQRMFGVGFSAGLVLGLFLVIVLDQLLRLPG